MKRRSIICLLIAVLVFSVSMWTVAYGESLQEQMEEVEKEKAEVSSEMEELTTKIETSEAEVEEIQQNISAKESEISETESEIQQLKADMQERQDGLNARLRTMYKNGSVGYLDVLLGSGSISEFLNNLEMIQRIYQNDQDAMVELQEQHDLLESKQEVLANERAALSEEQQAEQVKMEELEEDKAALQKKLDGLNAEADAITAEIVKRQQANSNKNKNNGSRPSYSGGAMGWPCDSRIITSEFGYRIHPITGIYTGHTGMDIGCSMNDPVYASEDGTVILAEWYGGYGYAVVIDHGSGISTLYGHNDYLIAKEGDSVKRGQVIASAGSTGWSTGPHVHFEVRVNGEYVDPRGYL